MEPRAMKQHGALGFAGFSALVTVLIYFVGFGGQQTMVPIEVDFGMEMDATGGPAMRVWANTPLPTLINARLFNMSKREEDGTITTGVDMFELMPTDDNTNYGIGFNSFAMTLIPPSAQPELNLTMKMVPMVFTRDVEVGKFVTGVMWFMAFSLKNFSALCWALILQSVGILGAGVALIMRNKKKDLDSVVTPIVPTKQ